MGRRVKDKKNFANNFRRYVKDNSITDRRLGQGNKVLSAADRAGLRYVAQRKHLFNKRDNKYNLNDKDESLNHLAHKMTESEEYRKGVINLDDEGEIDPEVFAQASFGGGSIKGKVDEKGRKLTRSEIMADLIANSKRMKELRQKEKEVQLEQWEKLDEQFFELKRSGELEFGREKFAPEDDDYSALYLQLQEDGSRAKALLPKNDPIKRAEYEAEQAKSGEADRYERMADTFANEDHISADFDPGYRRKKVEDEDLGKHGVALHFDNKGKATLRGILKKPDKDGVDWIGSDEDDVEEEAEDVEEDEEGDEEEVEDDEEAEDGDDDEEIEEEVDDMKDILNDDDEDGIDDADVEDVDFELDDDIEEEEEAVEPPTATATVKPPKTLPPSVKKIFEDIVTGKFIERSELDNVGKEIFDCASNDSARLTAEFRTVLSKLVSKRQKNSREPPEFGEYAFFKLVGNVFSVSDRVHPICVPALCLAVRIISKCRIKGALYCAKILMLCNEIGRWNTESKRYLPEVMAFLLGTLQLATENPVGKIFPIPVFPVSMPFRRMLFFDSKSRLKKIPPISVKNIFSAENEDDVKGNRLLDLQIIRLTVRLVRYFAELYDNIAEAYPLIFGQFLSLLEKLPADKYPKLLTDEVTETTELVRKLVTERSSFKHLFHTATKKVKMIEMFECKMDDDRRQGDKEYEKRMQKRANTQKRAAIREFRHDAKSDTLSQREHNKYESAERIRKTKRIMAALQGQESEYQKRKKMR